jgi:hypothetical protein
MRCTSSILASAILFAFSDSAFATKEKGQKTLFKDDQSYWNRVLSKGYPGSSMPTPPPTPRPTNPPTFPGPCDVKVDVTCTLDSDPTGSTSCDVLEEVTDLQCTGCPPVALCFTFTAAPCPPESEFPPGMTSCNDFNDGPQTMADITISNGMKMFVDGTFMQGAEFCITDDGAELPDRLFVFINAPEGGMSPVANQLSVIDSTCQGQGLTLLQSYGALNLVHYINCNGDNDCFVPVTYTHKVTNDGPVGLTITEMDRVLNGDPLDLIADADPADLRLEEGEMFTKEDPVIAECCMGVGLDLTTTVVALGDDGKICNDVEALTFEKPIATGKPSSTPSEPPTPLPSAPPTPEPSTSPSEPPTPEPSSAPSEPPTPEPSGSPSEPPTPGPTPEPTTPPTGVPSFVPTPPPSTFPPGDECFVQIGVTCTPPPGFTDCDSITPPRDECGEKVFSMGFRYQGGDCSNSFNIQDPQIYQCEDYNGSPPIDGDAQNHFVVTDIKGLGVNYFTGTIGLGDDFELTNGGALLGANVNVTIYDSVDNQTPSGILQTMVIHTSCSQVTFLKDRYGAIQLLSFNNTLQGFVSCFADITFDFGVSNVLGNVGAFTAILESLVSVTNFDSTNGDIGDDGLLNFTSQVAGVEVAPGESIALPTVAITLDLSMRKLYTIFSILQGASPDGFSCRDFDDFNFTAATTIIPPINGTV